MQSAKPHAHHVVVADGVHLYEGDVWEEAIAAARYARAQQVEHLLLICDYIEPMERPDALRPPQPVQPLVVHQVATDSGWLYQGNDGDAAASIYREQARRPERGIAVYLVNGRIRGLSLAFIDH